MTRITPVIATPASIKPLQPVKQSSLPEVNDELYPAPKAPLQLTLRTSKPELPKPLTVPLYGVIQSLSHLWDIGDMRLNMHTKLMDGFVVKLKKISQDHVDLIEKTAVKTQTSEYWSLFRKIGSCLVSAFSTLLGISVAATGGSVVLAGTMIASGILTITNLAFSEMGLWDDVARKLYPTDKDKREKFLKYIPTAIGLTAGALGLASSVGAVTQGAVTAADKTMLIISSAFRMAEGVATVGETFTKANAQFSEAELKQLESTLFDHQHSLSNIQNRFSKTLELMSNCSSKVGLIVSKSIQSSEEITLKG